MANHSHHPEHASPAAKKQLHKDWRLWVVVVLMLAGMAAYILSDDESVVPGGRPQNAVELPAAVE